ncbi:hypothetical protein ACEQPO_20155 [Bacillus sp. SL00103]
MIQTDDQIIEKTAAKLGLIDRAGWEGMSIIRSISNSLIVKKPAMGDKETSMSKSHCPKTAIDKKMSKTTPLQMANMMASIARAGNEKVKIAEKVLYQNGTTMPTFQNKRPEGGSIDRYTAQKAAKVLKAGGDV